MHPSAGIKSITNFKGLPIVIENPVGSVRTGVDNAGEPWQTKFYYPYGYIFHTKGADDDGVDCFIGNNPTSDKVFIIHQTDGQRNFDEDKVMLGFDTKEQARDAYLAHYQSQGYIGVVTEMPFYEFKELLTTKGQQGLTIDKKTSKAHWVTLKKENSESEGARRILLKGGKIVGGDVPKKTHGKKLSSLSKLSKPDKTKKSKQEPAKKEKVLKPRKEITKKEKEYAQSVWYEGVPPKPKKAVTKLTKKIDKEKLKKLSQKLKEKKDTTKYKMDYSNRKLDLSDVDIYHKKVNFQNTKFERGRVDDLRGIENSNMQNADFTSIKDMTSLHIDELVLSNNNLLGAKIKGMTVTKEYIDNIKHNQLIDKSFGGSWSNHKHKVVTNLASKIGVPYEEVNHLVHSWAETSADHSPSSLAIQEIAKKLLGLNKASTKHFYSGGKDKKRFLESNKTKLQKFITQQYKDTQQYLKGLGLKPNDTVSLYRGVDYNLKGSKVALQPLSSFSTSLNTAADFAEYDGTIMKIDVKVKDIFSTPKTGVGCNNEREVVVLGNVYKLSSKVPQDLFIGDALDGDSTEYIDDKLSNADWIKSSFDFGDMKLGSPEFIAFLKSNGRTMEDFMKLPIYQLLKAKGKTGEKPT